MGDYEKYCGHRRFSKEYMFLKGILSGIKADGEIVDSEIEELSEWCLRNAEFEKYYPFRDLIPIVRSATADGIITTEEIADMFWVIESIDRNDIIGDFQTQSMNKLHGILHGVLADGELRDEEIFFTSKWIDDNQILKGTYPYDEIESVIVAALKDQKISEDERNMLMALISNFVDVSRSKNMSREKFKEMQQQYTIEGICSVNPDITIKGSTFCFTGASQKVGRKEIAEIILSAGGTYHDVVTNSTDFLIVGNDSSPCWAFSCYGRKVEKAHEMRKNGHHIQIVNELDFWDAL